MIIIQDTREQQGWDFFDPEVSVIREKLDAGDYTLDGKSSLIIIERKASTGELANNLGSNWDRFVREFERMLPETRKVIICEFSMQDIDSFPINSGIPHRVRKYLRISSGFLKKRIRELEEKFNIEFIFAGDKLQAQEAALEILKQYED